MRCISIDDDAVSRRVLAEFISRTDTLIDTGQFDNSISAINFLKTTPVELIFLDVCMPGMDGFEFIDTLEYQPQVIMVSGSPDYALKAFDFGATDYMLKPLTYSRFYRGVSKALRWMSNPLIDDELYLKKDSALVRVPYNSILWAESMENYVNIYTEEEKFTLHFTLKATVGHLPAPMFRRIHRCYLVNVSRIECIEDKSILIRRQGEPVWLPIGKVFRDSLLGSLRSFSQK